MRTKAIRLLKEVTVSHLGHRRKLRSIWSGWEPRVCPVLHLPGQQALPGKPSSSQSTPGQAGDLGVLRKLRFFLWFSAAFCSTQTKNSVPRWSSTRYKHSHLALGEFTDLDQDFTPCFICVAMQATSFALQIPICVRNQTWYTVFKFTIFALT